MSQFETIRIDDLPDAENDYSPIPAGDYTVGIKDAELKDTKDGHGQYIKLKLDVIAPTNVGRIIFANINIKNNSQVAENIGRTQLKTIMRALGLVELVTEKQLIGGTLIVKVAIKEAQNGYEAQNEVKAYKAAGVSMPAAIAATPAPATGKATPPWGAKKTA